MNNPRSSSFIVNCGIFHYQKRVVNSLTIVTYIFSTKEVLRFGKGVCSGGGERSFPSEVLVKASWRCGSQAGLLYGENIMSKSTEAGKNRVGNIVPAGRYDV